MKEQTLVLRLSRRALAAVVLSDDRLAFVDGCTVLAQRERAVMTATRWLSRWLALIQPRQVVLEFAGRAGSQAATIADAIKIVLEERCVPVKCAPLSEVLYAFGLPALRARRQLRELVAVLLPQLRTIRSSVGPYLHDAAAVALWTESQSALGLLPL